MARRLFSRAENEAFRTVAPEQRDEAFLNCWTRKEALVKAVADGLSVPLHSFDVTLLPGEPARLLHGTGRFAPKQWTLRELPAGPSAIAALAVEGGGISVRFQDWLPES
jgi:4'-phosphopantetheinyl transferase